ncbi:hypothetical protein QBC38DRAFT_514982 [Podospora fimiseda]|uniref:Uncharacterized protein n=1 Tax=Podospora fimiseda TaxID=252190 RepID=A0AAN7BJE8_9PEZI|nr:hypothetical protein QBC38DRAFT_514982 [Podospora fimiseda]
MSNIYANIKGFFAPSVVDGRLNPVSLALATRFYYIQSRIFRIHDRFGFFSPIPRLQIDEVAVLFVAVFFVLHVAFYGALIVFFLSLGDEDDKTAKMLDEALIWLLLSISPLVVMWILMCFNTQRAPDYIWEDWKVRTE